MTTTNVLRLDENFEKEIYIYASRTDWGAFCNGDLKHELFFHINYLEFLAIYMGLKCFEENLIAQYCYDLIIQLQ